MVREVRRITDAGFALSENAPVIERRHDATLHGDVIVEPSTNRSFLWLFGWRDQQGVPHRIEQYVPVMLVDPWMDTRWLGGEILDALLAGIDPLQAIGGAALTLAGATGQPSRVGLPWS